MYFYKNGRSHLIRTDVKVQPSGRLAESEVGVGGLHFGWIFLCFYNFCISIISGSNFQFGEVLIGRKLVCRKAFLATASFTEIGNKMR